MNKKVSFPKIVDPKMLSTASHPQHLDGLAAEDLFADNTGITYRDYLALPGYIDFDSKDVNLESKLSREITLNLPFISSPMDTVTEAEMAISLSLMGGIGIIHYNNSQEEQLHIVEKVKRYKNGFILDPVVLSPEHKISDIDKIKRRYGFSGIPITQDGTRNTPLVGIVTNRDIDLETDRSITIRKLMSVDLVTAKEESTVNSLDLKEANQILKQSKKRKLPK